MELPVTNQDFLGLPTFSSALCPWWGTSGSLVILQEVSLCRQGQPLRYQSKGRVKEEGMLHTKKEMRAAYDSGWSTHRARIFLDIRTENKSGWTCSSFNIIPEVQVGGARASSEDFFKGESVWYEKMAHFVRIEGTERDTCIESHSRVIPVSTHFIMHFCFAGYATSIQSPFSCTLFWWLIFQGSFFDHFLSISRATFGHSFRIDLLTRNFLSILSLENVLICSVIHEGYFFLDIEFWVDSSFFSALEACCATSFVYSSCLMRNLLLFKLFFSL